MTHTFAPRSCDASACFRLASPPDLALFPFGPLRLVFSVLWSPLSAVSDRFRRRHSDSHFRGFLLTAGFLPLFLPSSNWLFLLPPLGVSTRRKSGTGACRVHGPHVDTRLEILVISCLAPRRGSNLLRGARELASHFYGSWSPWTRGPPRCFDTKMAPLPQRSSFSRFGFSSGVPVDAGPPLGSSIGAASADV